jgi:Flp pilus assembly protein TadD
MIHNFERAEFLLLLTQLRSGKLDAALSAAQALVKKNPNKAQAHNLCGAVLETRKELDAARQAYQRSATLAPKERAGALIIARMDLRAGQTDAAKRGVQSVLDRYPSDPTALLALAKIASDNSETKQSLELLERAPGEEPDRRATALDPGELLPAPRRR